VELAKEDLIFTLQNNLSSHEMPLLILALLKWYTLGERSFAWWGHNRRLSKDYEKTTSSCEEASCEVVANQRKMKITRVDATAYAVPDNFLSDTL